MTPVNRIITRGMGTSRGKPGRAGLVTQGYGGPPRAVIENFRRRIIVGGGSKRRAWEGLDEVIVWAKLISVNGRPAPKKVEGFIRVGTSNGFARAMVEHVSTRIRAAWEDIRIVVKRLK